MSNNPLENVAEFRYLGTTVKKHNYMDEEFKIRLLP
jgi:hypothetical protein